jgi:hypothetical protein
MCRKSERWKNLNNLKRGSPSSAVTRPTIAAHPLLLVAAINNMVKAATCRIAPGPPTTKTAVAKTGSRQLGQHCR